MIVAAGWNWLVRVKRARIDATTGLAPVERCSKPDLPPKKLLLLHRVTPPVAASRGGGDQFGERESGDEHRSTQASCVVTKSMLSR
jgi:hypothetical protein